MSVDTESLRLQLQTMLDRALSWGIMIPGDQRTMLRALNRYVADMTTDDLNRFESCIHPIQGE